MDGKASGVSLRVGAVPQPRNAHGAIRFAGPHDPDARLAIEALGGRDHHGCAIDLSSCSSSAAFTTREGKKNVHQRDFQLARIDAVIHRCHRRRRHRDLLLPALPKRQPEPASAIGPSLGASLTAIGVPLAAPTTRIRQVPVSTGTDARESTFPPIEVCPIAVQHDRPMHRQQAFSIRSIRPGGSRPRRSCRGARCGPWPT